MLGSENCRDLLRKKGVFSRVYWVLDGFPEMFLRKPAFMPALARELIAMFLFFEAAKNDP